MRSSTDTEVAQYDDLGDRASVKDKEKRAKVREERRINALKQVMGSADGRLFMWEFLSSCGLFSVAFNGNSRDYFNLGQRNAGMPLFLDIQRHCMDQYLLMAKENANA
ncbi:MULTISPECIES: hypothetical protein [Ralstonia]|uniref:Bbp19-like phage domain-containing protein n=1 Tax=Ralstonia condita TaxID=3058600 RepID=A0ABM9J0Y9_9RALS|nr:MULTISPECIES: hypothetical protein [Ralstonia]MBB0023636.1 hypothetical protein [Ralstonia pickettii]MBB0097005.1 hypothetical protein [Ralstonia pickettii]MBB0107025.1 hypothetical protein [Ralstonia pickettii]MBB0127778.1 hypothetical protein [Ralstonia pickettii]MBB0160725.1 hypothetical protein [Ralstonia pickettii]